MFFILKIREKLLRGPFSNQGTLICPPFPGQVRVPGSWSYSFICRNGIFYGSRPLKSTGRHGHFLNSIGRQGLFLKSTGDMENKGQMTESFLKFDRQHGAQNR